MLRSEPAKKRAGSHERRPTGQAIYREPAQRTRSEQVLVMRSQPHPPAQERPPSSRRASFGRQRIVRGASYNTGVAPSPQASRVSSPTECPSRPLSRYRVLPSISRRSSLASEESGDSSEQYARVSGLNARDSESITSDTGLSARDSELIARDSGLSARDSVIARDTGLSGRESAIARDIEVNAVETALNSKESRDDARNSELSARHCGQNIEPSEHVLHLALRLPDGRRVQGDFLSEQRLEDLLSFALSQMTVTEDDTVAPNLTEARVRFELLSTAERRVVREWSKSLADLGIADRSLYILQDNE